SACFQSIEISRRCPGKMIWSLSTAGKASGLSPSRLCAPLRVDIRKRIIATFAPVDDEATRYFAWRLPGRFRSAPTSSDQHAPRPAGYANVLRLTHSCPSLMPAKAVSKAPTPQLRLVPYA